jgi:replicative DNA helicase
VMTGLPTGIERLNGLIGGWQIGIVQLLCGRPAMGKSSALMASIDACSAVGVGAHLFTMEDSITVHGDRALSRESMVPSSDIRALKLNREQFENLKAARRKLHKRKGWIIDERAGLTADEIVRCARKHAKANGTKLVVVDYINLVRSKYEDAHQALTEICKAFATSAKNDGFAYLVAAQLNRGLEKRDDKRPVMSDLRESGSLEELAKLIVSVYRSAYYYASPKQGIDWDEQAPAEASIPKSKFEAERLFARTVQLGVIKNNGGPTGTIHAQWDAPTTRIW